MSEIMPSQEMDETPVHDPFNRTNPRSFINLVPTVVQARIFEAYQKAPDLFGVPERLLYKVLRSNQKTPTPEDNRLRLQFWQQFDIAQLTQKNMNMEHVCVGVCQREYLWHRYMLMPHKVAWMCTMPTTYDTYLTEALAFGLEQLRDVLELDHQLPNGKVDTKLLELKAKIVFALDARKNGGIVQRVEQKQMNLNISTTDRAVAQAALGGTMEDMEKRLKQLEKEERKLLQLKEQEAAQIEPRTLEPEVIDK